MRTYPYNIQRHTMSPLHCAPLRTMLLALFLAIPTLAQVLDISLADNFDRPSLLALEASARTCAVMIASAYRKSSDGSGTFKLSPKTLQQIVRSVAMSGPKIYGSCIAFEPGIVQLGAFEGGRAASRMQRSRLGGSLSLLLSTGMITEARASTALTLTIARLTALATTPARRLISPGSTTTPLQGRPGSSSPEGSLSKHKRGAGLSRTVSSLRSGPSRTSTPARGTST